MKNELCAMLVVLFFSCLRVPLKVRLVFPANLFWRFNDNRRAPSYIRHVMDGHRDHKAAAWGLRGCCAFTVIVWRLPVLSVKLWSRLCADGGDGAEYRVWRRPDAVAWILTATQSWREKHSISEASQPTKKKKHFFSLLERFYKPG